METRSDSHETLDRIIKETFQVPVFRDGNLYRWHRGRDYFELLWNADCVYYKVDYVQREGGRMRTTAAGKSLRSLSRIDVETALYELFSMDPYSSHEFRQVVCDTAELKYGGQSELIEIGIFDDRYELMSGDRREILPLLVDYSEIEIALDKLTKGLQ